MARVYDLDVDAQFIPLNIYTRTVDYPDVEVQARARPKKKRKTKKKSA